MRFVQAHFSARKDGESSFIHCVGAVKHVQACLSTCKDGESSFQHYWRCCETRASPFECQERARKQFSSLWGC